jgi:hypothetical protein
MHSVSARHRIGFDDVRPVGWFAILAVAQPVIMKAESSSATQAIYFPFVVGASVSKIVRRMARSSDT